MRRFGAPPGRIPGRRVSALTVAILPLVDSLAEIEDLLAHKERGAGTDAERRAARHLVGRLHDNGREADTEATSVHPRYALTHLIHVFLALGGGLLATAASDTAKIAGTLSV